LDDYNGDGSALWTDAQCIQAKGSIEANAFEYDGCVCPDDPRLLTMPPSLSPTGTLAPTTAPPATPAPTMSGAASVMTNMVIIGTAILATVF
jgi:hypothetical protein